MMIGAITFQAACPALPPSKYIFHPIGQIEMCTSENPKDDHTAITCSSSVDEHEAMDDMNMEIYTPYPAHTTTNEEIQEWNDLELSLGENWSLRLADDLSSVEMSLDGCMEFDEEYDDEASLFADDSDQAPSTPVESSFQLLEDAEIRRKRNLLWKQSLKTSMFTTQS